MRMQTHGGNSTWRSWEKMATWSPGENLRGSQPCWHLELGLPSRSCGKISVCYLSLWVWGALWWQPQQTNAVPKQLLQKRKGNLPSSPCPPCSTVLGVIFSQGCPPFFIDKMRTLRHRATEGAEPESHSGQLPNSMSSFALDLQILHTQIK